MAYKIHLRANKIDGNRPPFAICAARNTGNGKVRSNSRSSYQTIPLSNIVGPLDFRAAYEADNNSVCAHCCGLGLERMNRQRKAEGRELASSYFER